MDSLLDEIESRLRGRSVVVVGIGNRLRGDDGVGPRVVERVAVAGPELVIDAGTTPENFLGPLIQRAPQVVLFVDAIEFGKAPGHFILSPVEDLAGRLSTTHAPSLQLVADILAAYGIECWVLGIQPARTTVGAALHPRVERAAEEAAEALAWVLCREVSRV